MTHPRIPDLAPQADGETYEAFGYRVLKFLLEHGVYAGVLDTEALTHAAVVSQRAVASPVLLDLTRERLRNIRFDILRTLDRRAKVITLDQRLKAALDEAHRINTPPTPDVQGGSKVPRKPVPIAPLTGAAFDPL